MIKKTGVISLILVLLLSTYGISINEHYCGGKLAGNAIFIEATCACGSSEMDADCCKNESEYHQFDKDFTVIVSDVNLRSAFSADFIYNSLSIYADRANEYSTFLNFKPPIIERDITLLVQSFLV